MKACISRAEKFLASADSTLAQLIERHGPCTLMQDPGPRFHVLVWAIINQQLSVKAARSIETRLLERLRTQHFTPESFHRIQARTLRSCGLSGAKIRYIRELSRRVRSRELELESLDVLDDEQVSAALMAVPGIGRWTADMVLMFSLGRLDVLPVGDLALRKSIQMHYDLPADAGFETYIEVAENWRPYRTVASWYYWAAVD